MDSDTWIGLVRRPSEFAPESHKASTSIDRLVEASVMDLGCLLRQMQWDDPIIPNSTIFILSRSSGTVSGGP